MRVFASLSAASLALLAGSAAEAAPRRVASLNLCTDELLLLLARPEQIASVTHLARQEAETPLWREALRYPQNDGSLLSVVDRRPDLIVTMGGGTRDRLGIAARLGIKTLDLVFAQTLGDVGENVRRLASAIGRPEAGAAVLRRMNALIRSRPPLRVDTI
jgi:iron complex transport system substrate-binding protein